MDLIRPKVGVNEREYAWPQTPAIVICLDGCETEYLTEATTAGLMPSLKRISESGTVRSAHSVIPSFTNPNNLSIATGRPPSVHGISGNYFYDAATGSEVMMNDPKFLCAPTVFRAFYEAGAKVAIVTAKDKLRTLLGHRLAFDDGRAICFSSEKADRTSRAENGLDNASAWLGRPVPEVYSADLSEFVFAAGVKLLREFRPDVMYLTTTDYIQHKHAPGTPEANSFYAMFDGYLGELDALGATIVVTADHGMNAKHSADGAPDVIYVQELLDQWLGAGAARVILPITDPYVVHHGALGSFATAYLPPGADGPAIIGRLMAIDGIDAVLDRAAASERFELPPDRIGDIVIVSARHKVLGVSHAHHDIAALKEPIRSHGGLTEQVVPFIVNRRLPDLPAAPVLRNFDALFYATTAAGLRAL